MLRLELLSSICCLSSSMKLDSGCISGRRLKHCISNFIHIKFFFLSIKIVCYWSGSFFCLQHCFCFHSKTIVRAEVIKDFPFLLKIIFCQKQVQDGSSLLFFYNYLITFLRGFLKLKFCCGAEIVSLLTLLLMFDFSFFSFQRKMTMFHVNSITQ